MHETLRLRRIKRGIGLRELARKLGVDPSALYRWEHGTWTPTPEHAKAWKRALK